MSEQEFESFKQGRFYYALMSIFSGVIPDVSLGSEKQLVKLSNYQSYSLFCNIKYNGKS